MSEERWAQVMREEASVPPEYLNRGADGVAEYIRLLRSQLIGEKAKTEYLYEQIERKK